MTLRQKYQTSRVLEFRRIFYVWKVHKKSFVFKFSIFRFITPSFWFPILCSLYRKSRTFLSPFSHLIIFISLTPSFQAQEQTVSFTVFLFLASSFCFRLLHFTLHFWRKSRFPSLNPFDDDDKDGDNLMLSRISFNNDNTTTDFEHTVAWDGISLFPFNILNDWTHCESHSSLEAQSVSCIREKQKSENSELRRTSERLPRNFFISSCVICSHPQQRGRSLLQWGMV